MNKIPMWWTIGFEYAATSPLAYSLQYTNRYCHSGFVKESRYLISTDLSQPEHLLVRTNKHTRNIVDNGINFEDNDHICDKKYYFDISKIWTPNNTLEKYISYYQHLWEKIKCDYQAVADYTNLNRDLDPEYLNNIVPKLKEVFDIKIGIIVRDPVRRVWSDKGRKVRQDKLEDIFKFKPKFDYFYHYDRFSEHFPVHFIVMEELWEDDGSEKEKLSKFINYPLGKLYKNAYSPDRGHLLKKDDSFMSILLRDQYLELRELTPEIYEYGKERFIKTYNEWEERFGSLPLHWGKPLNYV